MIVVNSDLATNVIKYLPRNYNTASYNVDVILTNEDNRVVYNDRDNYITDSYTENEFYLINLAFDFSEGDIYNLKIVNNDDGEILFRGKLFATSQDTQKYKING